MQVLKEDGKPATSESRMWLYASGEYSKDHIRIFEYQPDRSGKRPESFLKGFTGCLVTDGYAGYNQVAKVTHCGCWAHYPRKTIIREECRNALVFRHFFFFFSDNNVAYFTSRKSGICRPLCVFWGEGSAGNHFSFHAFKCLSTVF